MRDSHQRWKQDCEDRVGRGYRRISRKGRERGDRERDRDRDRETDRDRERETETKTVTETKTKTQREWLQILDICWERPIGKFKFWTGWELEG